MTFPKSDNMLLAMTDHFQFVHLLQIWNKWHCSAHRALSTHTGGSTVLETETERQRLEWSRKSFSSHLGSAKLAKSYQIFTSSHSLSTQVKEMWQIECDVVHVVTQKVFINLLLSYHYQTSTWRLEVTKQKLLKNACFMALEKCLFYDSLN